MPSGRIAFNPFYARTAFFGARIEAAISLWGMRSLGSQLAAETGAKQARREGPNAEKVQKLPPASYFFEPWAFPYCSGLPSQDNKRGGGHLRARHQQIETKLATMIGPTASKVYPTAKPSLGWT